MPTVLMIMGLGLPSCCWPKNIIRRLTQKGLHVITVDNRDSGESQHFTNGAAHQSVPLAVGRAVLRMPVTAPYRLEDMALDLVALLDYLNISSAHLIGISMGGMIAQVMATIRPSRVKSMTAIMSASGNPRTGLGKIKAIYSLLMHPSRTDDDASVQKHFELLFKNLKSPNYEYDAEAMQEILTGVLKYPLDTDASERQLLAILASGDRSAQLSRLTIPSLIMHGQDDPLLPLTAGKELADLIPKAKFKIFPKMGHDLPPIHHEEIVTMIAKHVWESEH